jgi:hypothetical protein
MPGPCPRPAVVFNNSCPEPEMYNSLRFTVNSALEQPLENISLAIVLHLGHTANIQSNLSATSDMRSSKQP